MTTLLLDTHSWVWSFADDSLLSPRAREAVEAADIVLVSPISFYEIGQKVRLGKWPEMAPLADRLVDILGQQGGTAARLDPSICARAALMPWPHRDPFDRLLAATALDYGIGLVSADAIFDGVVPRLW